MPEAVLYLLKIREFPLGLLFLPDDQGLFLPVPGLLPLLQAGLQLTTLGPLFQRLFFQGG